MITGTYVLPHVQVSMMISITIPVEVVERVLGFGSGQVLHPLYLR